MSQHDYILDNQSGANFRSDINNALAAIVSANSGATEPTTTYAYQFWADTTNAVLKLRNGSDTAWIEFMDLNTGNIIIKGATAQLKLEDTDGDGDYATISASSNGAVTVSSDPTNTGANSQIRFFADGVEHGRISTGGAVFGDGSSDGIPSAFCITDNSPVIRLTDTDSVSTEIAQVFTDANGRLFLSADPNDVNGSSEVRIMDNSDIVARFRSGVGMTLFDDDHRLVIGSDAVRSVIGRSELSATPTASTTSTSSVSFAADFSHTCQRTDGTSEFLVTFHIEWDADAGAANQDAACELELYYDTGSVYQSLIGGGLDAQAGACTVGHRNLNTDGATFGRASFSFKLDSSFIRSDAPMITLRPGGRVIDSGATLGVNNCTVIIEEVLI